jgi:hypothetical protein
MFPAIILMVAVALTINANAVYWSSSVDTNSSHWSIYRQSSNVNFDLSGTVDGNVSHVDSHGRVLGSYQAYYAEVGTNDVRLRERISALAGSYRSEDAINMKSNADNDIDILVVKPIGTNVYTIDNYEQWPVSLTSSRMIAYSGQQINDREFEGNNGDFVGSNFLYNHELIKESRSVMWLQRMNATVLSTNDSILAEFEPTKYLGYLITANTTGIADLSYRFRSPHYDVKHQNYPALSKGDERYYGTFGLARKIEMRSIFENNDTSEYDWLPCCLTNNWANMGVEGSTDILR